MKISGFIIISLFVCFSSSAQNEDIVPDTVKGKFIPSGIRVGFDLISFGQDIVEKGIQAFSGDGFNELHFTADIDFYRYFLNIEYGIYNRQWTRTDGFYINTGDFYKIGPDINLLHRDPDASALFFGLRYAWANFSDEVVYNTESEFWGSGGNRVSNDDLSADWFELTTGLKVKLTRILWLGYTARFKFSVDTFEGRQLIPHWIPGFGRADERTWWGLDYWLIIKIPFKKEVKAEPNTD